MLIESLRFSAFLLSFQAASPMQGMSSFIAAMLAVIDVTSAFRSSRFERMVSYCFVEAAVDLTISALMTRTSSVSCNNHLQLQYCTTGKGICVSSKAYKLAFIIQPLSGLSVLF
jgi:hypothetical protein